MTMKFCMRKAKAVIREVFRVDKKVAVEIAVFTVMANLVAYAFLQAQVTVHNTAKIRVVNISVWTYHMGLEPLTSIDWGWLAPGETKLFDCVVRNEGNQAVELACFTEDWIPAVATEYMTLTWNQTGYALGVGETVGAQLLLTVASDVQRITEFSFTIVLIGQGIET